jgi:hypothetical protein
MSFGHAAVRAVLELPDHFRPEILVAVGIPAAEPSKAAKAIPPIVHRNVYGTIWEGPS